MKVIGKDRTSCDVCNPIDEILARLDALERRASAIVAKVQGIAPDGEGNVTLPTSSSDTDPLHGRIDAFAMSSEVKEAADDAHAYAASIADDVVVLQSDVEILTREVDALDPASVTALEQSVAALQQTVNQLSNLVGGISAVIRDLEDQMPNKVDRTGDTMTGPLIVIDTVTGSRNTQAVNGNRLQNDLDNYGPMLRQVGDFTVLGKFDYKEAITAKLAFNTTITAGKNGNKWVKIYTMASTTLNFKFDVISSDGLINVFGTNDGIGGHFAWNSNYKPSIKMVVTNTSELEIWFKIPRNYIRLYFQEMITWRYGGYTTFTTPPIEYIDAEPSGVKVFDMVEV